VENMSINSVIKKYEDRLMSLPNVTGIGIGKRAGREILIVFVTKKVPKIELDPSDMVPESLEGYEIQVDEMGTVTAQE